jgi:hypothetical protein
MLLLPEYTGVDLPIHEAHDASIVFDPRSSQIVEEEANFVRALKLITPFGLRGNINTVLERTDRELEHAAQSCEAVVVNHTWGLYKLDDPYSAMKFEFLPKQRRRLRIPKDHILVAEVEYVPSPEPAHPSDERYASLKRGLDAYYGRDGLKLSDLAVEQFVASSSFQQLVLVDIEPRWNGSKAHPTL